LPPVVCFSDRLDREQFLGFSPAIALPFFILSYIASGYDTSQHAVPALLRGKLDTDVLMLAAAAGAAILVNGPKALFCCSCSASDTPASIMPSTALAMRLIP
jgi:cation transport ATPase